MLRCFEALSIADKDPFLCASSDADHDSRRSGKP